MSRQATIFLLKIPKLTETKYNAKICQKIVVIENPMKMLRQVLIVWTTLICHPYHHFKKKLSMNFLLWQIHAGRQEVGADFNGLSICKLRNVVSKLPLPVLQFSTKIVHESFGFVHRKEKRLRQSIQSHIPYNCT